ncbi:NAD(P)H dehydrogenase assembly family protein [Prochlorococcus marinus]|nr:NAD(P)H dehydrogenase assembly family protein [Prochlorococcus marinus]
MKFEIKDKVKLIAPVSYLKTSDNMPMLRPPDLVAIDEIGEIISIKSPDTLEVKFRRGAFLIDIDKIERI